MLPPPPPTENAEKTSEKALERVKILRVFDFVGVVEAVNELSEELRHEVFDGGTEGIRETERQPQSRPAEQHKTRTEIADSDDEDEEDMLFDSPSTAIDKSPIQAVPDLPSHPSNRAHSPEKIGMIVIDNITQVVNPILKVNYVRGITFLLRCQKSHVNDLRPISSNNLSNFPPPLDSNALLSNHSPQYRISTQIHFQYLVHERTTKYMDPGTHRSSADLC